MHFLTRRDFMRIGSGSVVAGAAVKYTLLQPAALWGAGREVAASDRIRFASIGTGTRGCELLQASLAVPGIECVAVCDLYDSRHEAAQEMVQKQVPATRNYKEILDRKDVDAVIVAVPDHQHRRVVVDACAAGKDVYCEKPMSHNVEEGFAMVDAVHKGNRIMQVGSQRASSIVYEKARELYARGRSERFSLLRARRTGTRRAARGSIPFHPTRTNRRSTGTNFWWGRQQGHLTRHDFFDGGVFPTMARGSPETCSYTCSLEFILYPERMSPRRERKPVVDYSAGKMAANSRCYGNTLRLSGVPSGAALQLKQRGGEPIKFHGTKGTMEINGQTLTFIPQDVHQRPEEYSTKGWPARLRKQYMEQWAAEHPQPNPLDYQPVEAITYNAPQGYSDVSAHQAVFFDAVRTRKPTVENEVFGNNAAIGCHLANYAYFKNTIATWDGNAKTIRG